MKTRNLIGILLSVLALGVSLAAFAMLGHNDCLTWEGVFATEGEFKDGYLAFGAPECREPNTLRVVYTTSVEDELVRRRAVPIADEWVDLNGNIWIPIKGSEKLIELFYVVNVDECDRKRGAAWR